MKPFPFVVLQILKWVSQLTTGQCQLRKGKSDPEPTALPQLNKASGQQGQQGAALLQVENYCFKFPWGHSANQDEATLLAMCAAGKLHQIVIAGIGVITHRHPARSKNTTNVICVTGDWSA